MGNNLKHELAARKASLRRWEKYVGESRSSLLNPRQESLARKYINKLEGQIHEIEDELREKEGSKFWTTDLLRDAGEFVEDVVKRAEEYLHPKKVRRAVSYVIALFLAFLIFRNKGAVTGYSVVNFVTNQNYAAYFLMLVLILCLIAFYKLNKE